MIEPAFKETAETSPDASLDFNAMMDSLRAIGAERFDPVRWHYLEALAKRASTHQGSIRHMLDIKLSQALAAYRERLEHAQRNAKEIVDQCAQRYPDAAKDLRRYFDAGDFKGMRQLIASLKTREQCASLSALVRELEQSPADNSNTRMQPTTGSRPELKVIRDARNTWSKLSVDKQVAQALGQAPKNAGPINSHMLMLRSLALMREISPDYLNRFMTYADTLLCLDQYEKDKPSVPQKKPARTSKK
jgi:hypothetical protein